MKVEYLITLFNAIYIERERFLKCYTNFIKIPNIFKVFINYFKKEAY